LLGSKRRKIAAKYFDRNLTWRAAKLASCECASNFPQLRIKMLKTSLLPDTVNEHYANTFRLQWLIHVECDPFGPIHNLTWDTQ